VLRLDKDFLLISLGRVFQIIVSLVAVRVFTAFLSIAEVGNIYLINSIIGFFGLSLINPVQMYGYRKMYQWADEKFLINYFFLFNLYLSFLAFLSLPVTYVLTRTLGVANSLDLTHLMLFLMFYLYALTWNQTILPTLNMLNQRAAFVAFTCITLTVGIVLSIMSVKFFSATALGWLNGQLVAQGLVAVVALLYFRRIFRDRLALDLRQLIKNNQLQSVLVFVFPLCLTNFFMWLQNQSYRMIVEKQIGLEFLGMLGLGLSIASNVSAAVESIVQQWYYPRYYREISTDDPMHRTKAWNKMTQMILPIYTMLTIMMSCLAPFMMSILASRRFSGAFLFLIYGAWIELFRMTTNLLASVAHAEMQTTFLIRAYVAGGLIAVCGTYLVSRWYEAYRAIPLVLLVSGLVTMAVMYAQMMKLARLRVGIRQIGKAVLLSLPFVCAVPFYGHSGSLPVSLMITGVLGGYFAVSTYRYSGVFIGKAVLLLAIALWAYYPAVA